MNLHRARRRLSCLVRHSGPPRSLGGRHTSRAAGVDGVFKDISDFQDLVEVNTLIDCPRRVELERIMEVIPTRFGIYKVSWGNGVQPAAKFSDRQFVAL